MTKLVVEHVSKQFPTRGEPLVVLADVCLELERGENVAIVGPSGSGKSTLLSIIGTLEAPTAGRVLLAGDDPAVLDEPRWPPSVIAASASSSRTIISCRNVRSWKTAGADDSRCGRGEARGASGPACYYIASGSTGGWMIARRNFPAASGSGRPSPGH